MRYQIFLVLQEAFKLSDLALTGFYLSLSVFDQKLPQAERYQIFLVLQEAFELSDFALTGFHLSSSASHFAHAIFDLSPVAVTEGHALCSKVYTSHALYCQFRFLYQHPLKPC